MKKLLVLFFMVSSLSATAQTAGIVTYEYARDFLKMYSRLSFLSLDQRERIKATYKNFDNSSKIKMKLYFNDDQSMYTNESEYFRSEDGRWTQRNQDFIIRRDFKNETKSEVIEMLGRTYIIDDSLKTPKWKILNQLKEVAGHICMKAETEDPIKQQKIVAWFAQDILVPAGPEQAYGLPGLILELDIDDGVVLVTATQVELKDPSKELAENKKIKGKKIKNADYEKLIKDHIQTSIKSQQDPYWTMRY